MDVRLPYFSGLELLPRLRALDPRMSIIVITAFVDVDDAVRVLRDMDAADYVEKPFSLQELRCRVERALDRAGHVPGIKLGDLLINPNARRVECGTRELSFTRQEFDLLLYLARHRGQVVSYGELLEEVWHCQPSAVHYDAVRNAMSRLRKKLGSDPAHPRYFHTVRGQGYRVMD